MTLNEADIEEAFSSGFSRIQTLRSVFSKSMRASVLSPRTRAATKISTNNRRRKDIYRLSIADQEILESLGYKKKLDDVDKAILANAQFVAQIIENPEIFGLDADDGEATNAAADKGVDKLSDPETEQTDRSPGEKKFGSQRHSHPHSHSKSHGQDHAHTRTRNQKHKPSEGDMDKLRSTLKQLVRDWSSEGKEERGACYEPIKDALLQYYSHIPETERGKLRVLVPGAGLGRLAWDIAHLGFSCQGNEFSHYMLLSSFFVLNRTNNIEKHTIYPYVHSFSNIPNSRAMLRPIKIPDVLTSDLPSTADFSLVAGDFEEVYGGNVDPTEPHAGQWDAVLTCFFIDTAKNVINYLRIIHKILSPGGVWINLGPLLWHWENNDTNDPSIELTLEEVKKLAFGIGFELSNERIINTTYTNNAQSMMGYTYHTAFWTATKKLEQI